MALRKPDSICYMSLADAFVSQVTQDVITNNPANQSRLQSGEFGIEVVPVYTDRQSFIEKYLQHIYLTKRGIFSKHRSMGGKRPNLHIYDCERNNFCKGSSSGDPTKTRANGCKAYVSFQFEEGAAITVCVLRYRLHHMGHNPENREEFKVNRIDPTLKSCLSEWAIESSQITAIIPKIAHWNKVKGNADYKDRRYFPSYLDIYHIIWLHQKSQQTCGKSPSCAKSSKKYEIGVPAADKLMTLLKTKYKNLCLYYQPASINGVNSIPLILVLQNTQQREMYNMYGSNLVFVPKNFNGLRNYGSAVYALVIKDTEDVAFPIAYIICSTDDPMVFAQALHHFNQHNAAMPSAFLLDKDLLSYNNAILSVYPSTTIFIPRYQVIQSVHHWLSRSAVAEKEHREVRELLLKYIYDLSKCELESDFVHAVGELEQKVDFPEFTGMLQAEWLTCGDKWCNFARNAFFASPQEYNLVERLFLNLEHQLLKGLQSLYLVEDLVEHIYKDFLERSDQEAINMTDFLEGTPEEQAENLLHDGWGKLVTWLHPHKALIPSQADIQVLYQTDLITLECECASQPYKGLCVHIHLAQMLVGVRIRTQDETSMNGAKDSLQSQTPEQARQIAAREALDNSDYLVDAFSCSTFHSDIVCVTNLADQTCTCKASYFGVECVGLILLKKVQNSGALPPGAPSSALTFMDPPKEVVEEYTVSMEETVTAGGQGAVGGAIDAGMVNTIDSSNMVSRLDGDVIAEDSPTIAIAPHSLTDDSLHDTVSVTVGPCKKLIESLYLWSLSPDFVESDLLHGRLLSITAGIDMANYKSMTQKSPRTRVTKDRDTKPLRESPYNTNRRTPSKVAKQTYSPRKSTRVKGSQYR